VSGGPLEALLRTVRRALEAQQQRFAVVGGLAVSAVAEPRFTRDADVMVAVADDREAKSLVRSLRSFGLVPFHVTEQEVTGRLAMARMRSAQGMVCDLLLANIGIEEQIVARARPVEVFSGLILPVATVESLIAMKILSASDDRPQDRIDLGHLLDQGPDLDEVRELLHAITRAGCHREQDLLEKLDGFLQEG